MESLIGLVNRIQRACTVLGDYGGGDDGNTFSSLWEALPSVAVVGGQVRFFHFISSISCSFEFYSGGWEIHVFFLLTDIFFLYFLFVLLYVVLNFLILYLYSVKYVVGS
jgi:hypothetical protein